nr:unnamed protein product [Callosobruchus analis]
MQAGRWRAVAVLLLAELLHFAQMLPSVIKIGAIFTEDQKDTAVEVAFKYAVYKINKDKILLPYTSFTYDIQYIAREDSFHASKKACQLVGSGVYAVFGPSDPMLGAHIQSICDSLDIPHLETRPDADVRDLAHRREFSINLHPAHQLLNQAFLDVMNFLNWTKVAVIYEEKYGLIKLRELVRSPHKHKLDIHLRQANPDTYYAILKEIKAKEIHNIVIDTKPSKMHHFLKGILQLQMNDYKYHYLFTTFDMETLDLEDFKYNFVNMTAFRIVDIDDLHVKELLRGISKFQTNTDVHPINSSFIKAEAAFMYDSVFVFAVGLQTLDQSHTLKIPNVSCDKEHSWDGGLSLINYINAVEMKGLSGPIELKEGRRVHFRLDLLKLKRHALVKVGEWHPRTAVNITDREAFFDPGTMNVTLVVTTILEKPYVMMHVGKNFTGNSRFYGFCVDVLDRISKQVGFDYLLDLVRDGKYGARDPQSGAWNGMVMELMQHEQPYVMLKTPSGIVDNDQLEGFCIDLLKEIATMVGFEYKLTLVPDGKYGAYDYDTGEWNGMVKQLIEKKADLAVGSMTINYARESVIDFTKPFMNLGISILFKVPESQQARLFSFMKPLAPHIWLYVLSAYVLVSVTLFLVARFSPCEWDCSQCHHLCTDTDEDIKRETHFTLANSFWFAVGTLMQQGSDLNPRAMSTRIVSGTWWFFTLIIISSYTANLAAFLTVERMITPIEHAEGLASQTEIPYGTLESGSTMTFFRVSYYLTFNFCSSRLGSVLKYFKLHSTILRARIEVIES